MSGDRQSSDEVAHEAEDTRAHLASTLEQLRTNLRPENVVDEVVSNARIGAASLADNLGEVARRYPIPAVLMAAGSALAMRLFSRRNRPGEDFHEADEPVVVRPRPAVPLGRPVLLRNPSTFEPAPGRSAPYAIDATPDEEARHAMPYGQLHADSARSRLSSLFERQPLILGAIGLAVGAAIGAALPITETEENLLGPTAHRLRESANDAARSEVEGMRAAASEAFDNVRQATKDNVRNVVDRAGGSLEPESHGA